MKFNPNIKLAGQLIAALVLATQISACVPVVLGGAAAGGAIAADRRTSGVYVEDQNIELKASHSLDDVLTDLSHVNVTSYKGHVLLTGEVPDAATRTKAEDAVKVIESVRDVTNEITI